jgi:pyruvate dehydrogenase E2 component (dihydrolipoamide acetyltransferase)
MADLVMPRLSDTMEEGTILRWLKRDGDELQRGEELVEIETDKATMTYESDQEGILEIVASEGDTLAVGELIAHVGDGAPVASGAVASASVEGRVKASPLARRIAQESGVDLGSLKGSGPGGRIVKADVVGDGGATEMPGQAVTPADGAADDGDGAVHPEHATPAAGAQTPAAGGPTQAASIEERVASAKGETTIVALSRTQQTIARRMAESKATIPHFTLAAEVDMGACVRLRTELKRLAPAEPGGAGQTDAPTYNDMIVKAAALALREHPRANGSYRDGALQLHSRINVGVAVAAEDALVVPTIFDAEEKSLGEISRETRAVAERVRAGTVTPPELGGGTFTVSNLGMYGVSSFTAIINPPQVAILSVGSLEARALVRDGEIVAGHTITLTLACDHRILYGADAALFLKRIRELLETPSALTL